MLDELTPAQLAAERRRIGRDWVWVIHLLDPDTRQGLWTAPNRLTLVDGLWCRAQPGIWCPPRPDVELVEDIWDGANFYDLNGQGYERQTQHLAYATHRLRLARQEHRVRLARWWMERMTADVQANPGVLLTFSSCLHCRHDPDRFPSAYDGEAALE